MKQIYRVIFLLITLNLFFTDRFLVSQSSEGHTLVNADPALFSILNKKLTYDMFKAGYNGYRIQVFFNSGNNSKQGAYNAADQFCEMYKDVPAFVSFKEPYYRVRVGNFKTKLDADRLLNSVIKTFKSAFVVKEFISIFEEPYIYRLNTHDSLLIYTYDTIKLKN